MTVTTAVTARTARTTGSPVAVGRSSRVFMDGDITISSRSSPFRCRAGQAAAAAWGGSAARR